MDLEQRIDTHFVQDSPLPANVPTAEAWKTLAAQEFWELAHRSSDGLHDHPLIAHAYGNVVQAAGVYVLQAGSVGVTSVVKQGTGWLRITLSITMASPALWTPWVWILDQGAVVYPYGARDAGAAAKTATVLDVKLVTTGGILVNNSFGFAVVGKRA